jgi:MFS family permease
VCYGIAAPYFGNLADRTGKALHVSMGGLVGLALLLPLFAMPQLPYWALFPVAMLFGASATAQLTPASALLEQVAEQVVGEHPTLTYAIFNCAYVSGMAIGPGVLALLTDLLTFQLATLCIAAGALVISGCAACQVRHILTMEEN